MRTGTVMPVHSDLYKRYIELFNLQGQETSIHRALVLLEDWKPGHYFEILFEPYTKWEKMNFKIIRYGQPHLSGNMGMEPKYTMQITGLYEEFKRSKTYTESNDKEVHY
jgi:hypothetical protein